MGNDQSESLNRIALLGLENSGKSAFLKKLVDTKYPQKINQKTVPTLGFDYVTIEHQDKNLEIFDLGGDSVSRGFWQTFYRAVRMNMVLYFIDVMNPEQHNTSLKELIKIMNEEELKTSRILIIFNIIRKNRENNPLTEKERERLWENAQINAKQLLEKIKEYPIYKFDTRVTWTIEDILEKEYTDGFINSCFMLKRRLKDEETK